MSMSDKRAELLRQLKEAQTAGNSVKIRNVCKALYEWENPPEGRTTNTEAGRPGRFAGHKPDMETLDR